ncbi:MAG: hypothetical protein LBJ62_10845 [Bifidobacteriaceae bacterium]|jgi:hypothetical protein|nr:hypothetical protein [Bifidobacteriaceae bacterium]
MMDRVVFGDNQFFGVNHHSEAKAAEQLIQFQRIEAITGLLEQAYDVGLRTFMCTTHERIAEVVEHFKIESARYPEFVYYPCMPYAHKYANAVTEDGMLGALRRFVPASGFLDAAFRGVASVTRKDIEGVITLLVDAEMKMFAGATTPVIWLQNVVTDLLLGMGFDEAFRVFDEHVRKRYGAEPGFITMNLPMLAARLNGIGIDNPIICSNINKIGFRMSGGIEAYQAALERHSFRAVAMSVFASGAIPADEAISWVCEQPNIESIVFGASSRRNIVNTLDLVLKYSS